MMTPQVFFRCDWRGRVFPLLVFAATFTTFSEQGHRDWCVGDSQGLKAGWVLAVSDEPRVPGGGMARGMKLAKGLWEPVVRWTVRGRGPMARSVSGRGSKRTAVALHHGVSRPSPSPCTPSSVGDLRPVHRDVQLGWGARLPALGACRVFVWAVFLLIQLAFPYILRFPSHPLSAQQPSTVGCGPQEVLCTSQELPWGCKRQKP